MMTMTSKVLDETTTILKQAVGGFFLSCKVEGILLTSVQIRLLSSKKLPSQIDGWHTTTS